MYSARRPRKSQKPQEHLKTGAIQRPLLPAGRKEDLACIAALEHPKDRSGAFTEEEEEEDEDDEDDVVIPSESRSSAFTTRLESEESGRLYVAHGKSRYINSEKATQVCT